MQRVYTLVDVGPLFDAGDRRPIGQCRHSHGQGFCVFTRLSGAELLLGPAKDGLKIRFGGRANLGGVVGRAAMVVTAGPATESILYTFGATVSDGVQPSGSLVQASDGNFYGTTSTGGSTSCGGSNDCGTVFKITPAGVETILYSFGASASDGSGPGELIQASDGNFYGVGVGLRDTGTVFKLVP